MNKDDWKAFLYWLETAGDEELETTLLRIEARSAAFREEGAKAEARKLMAAINLERKAREAVR
jgi:hypothetical protein